ncbi:MAG: hypothetical protein KIT84_32745 [Labilithrix sp.]|nr:hypothetical protein [Labilithrix sp.]MCW5815844.1 hypothetical protein [Labilithrix sp.]
MSEPTIQDVLDAIAVLSAKAEAERELFRRSERVLSTLEAMVEIVSTLRAKVEAQDEELRARDAEIQALNAKLNALDWTFIDLENLVLSRHEAEGLACIQGEADRRDPPTS